MTYDKLIKLEKNYRDYLKIIPYFHSTKVGLNEDKEYAIWINYIKGMSIATKKEIATEMGDIPLKWNMIDEEKQKQ